MSRWENITKPLEPLFPVGKELGDALPPDSMKMREQWIAEHRRRLKAGKIEAMPDPWENLGRKRPPFVDL